MDSPLGRGSPGPALRLISGDATDEEIAAIVAVLTAARSAPRTAASAEISAWADPRTSHRGVRSVLTPGPNGWRTSFWPH